MKKGGKRINNSWECPTVRVEYSILYQRLDMNTQWNWFWIDSSFHPRKFQKGHYVLQQQAKHFFQGKGHKKEEAWSTAVGSAQRKRYNWVIISIFRHKIHNKISFEPAVSPSIPRSLNEAITFVSKNQNTFAKEKDKERRKVRQQKLGMPQNNVECSMWY